VSESRIAYFSMEIALHPAMPTYSGGLGILAGDMLRAAADRELPMLAVTLLHRKGYFYQTLDRSGWQTEDSVEWIVGDFLRSCRSGPLSRSKAARSSCARGSTTSAARRGQ
jgi:starch phosphorylase